MNPRRLLTSLLAVSSLVACGIEAQEETLNGPARAQAGAFVWVNSGQVCIGTGNGGNTSCNAYSTTTGQWEWLQANNGNSPANELIVYATSPGGADYFVGFARVNEIP